MKDKQLPIMRPSGMEGWLNCSRYATMLRDISDVISETKYVALKKGHKCHALAEHCLKTGTRAEDYPTFTFETEKDKQKITLEEEVTSSEAEATQRYIDYVLALLDGKNEGEVELKVDLSKWIPEGSGTSDCYVLDKENGILHIVDLKTGRHEVRAETSPQLRGYALGVYEYLGQPDYIKTIRLHIVQFYREVSTCELSIGELIQFGAFVKARAKACLEDDPIAIEGEKQCKYCTGKKVCPAYFEKQIEPVVKKALSTPKKYRLYGIPFEERMRIAEHHTEIIKFVELVRDDIIKDMRLKKIKPEGYELKRKLANSTWKPDAEKTLYKWLGKRAYNEKLIGIGEAKKRLAEVINLEVLSEDSHLYSEAEWEELSNNEKARMKVILLKVREITDSLTERLEGKTYQILKK